MARMKLASGEVYEIPDTDVELARSRYGATPADSVTSVGSNPLASVAGGTVNAVNAVGGIGGLAKIGGVGGSIYAGKKILDRLTQRGAAPPTPTPPMAGAPPDVTTPPPATVTPPAAPAGAKLPASITTVTAADKARFKALDGYEIGDEIQRSELTKIKRVPEAPAPTPRTPQATGAGRGARTTNKGGRPDPKQDAFVRRGMPTKPATNMQGGAGKPMRVPRATPESPGAGTGISGPEAARRQYRLAEMRAKRMGTTVEDALQSLKADLGARAAEGAMGRVAGKIGPAGPPALEALMYILGAADFPQQVDEAASIYRESAITQPSTRKALKPSPSY